MRLVRHVRLSTLSSSFAVAAITVLVGGVFVIGYLFITHRDASIIVHDIIATCADTEGEARSNCYEREVPTLYPRLSVPQVFDVVREVRHLDPSYQFCHVLAHRIGERVVAEDPDRWLSAMTLNPADGLCSNGYIHGVVGGRFRVDVLEGNSLEEVIPDFARACAPRKGWNPSDLDRAICYHGMGHLFDFITDANLPKALDICARTTPTGFIRNCIEGVFMQIYQPLEPEDFAMIERMPDKPGTTTVRTFCSKFSDPEYEGACLRESWPFAAYGIIDGSGVGAFCSGQPNADQTSHCYDTATAILARMNLGEPDRALAACAKLPDAHRSVCYTYSARAYIEEDRDAAESALSLCARAPSPYDTQCASALAGLASFFYGPDTRRSHAFCDAFVKYFDIPCDTTPRPAGP